MRERWNKVRLRAGNLLTRRRRIALDLLLALAVAWFTWQGCSYPMFGEAAFRRLEKQNFLAPGEIVFHQGRTLGGGESGHGRLTKEVFISLGEDWAAVGYLDSRGDYTYWKGVGPNSYTLVPVPDTWVETWALDPGPAVIPLLFPVRGPNKGEKDILGWGAAALRLPAGTTRGTLRLTGRDGREHILTGTLQGEGTLWFWEADGRFQSGGYYESDNRYVLGEPWMPGLDYTLELQADGERIVLTGNILE